MIVFNKPYFNEIFELNVEKLSGDGYYTNNCHIWIQENFSISKALLTTSCTDALEMSAILLDIKEGDEVIAPSFTFVSTVNAFALRGARIVFVDIRPDTMNIDEKLIELAITPKTKAIIPVHYAGVSCNMDAIMNIAKKHELYVVEDAAQGVMATYKGKALGSIGDLGTFSFHETKNYTMGEGGALLVNNSNFKKRAEIIREKGTNRSQFIRGQVDKYTWIDIGSSFLPSDINAAYLYPQLLKANEINEYRRDIWNQYYESLIDLKVQGWIDLPFVPNDCEHNAHMFYIKAKNLDERDELMSFLKTKDIQSTFHYIPLHSSPAGKKYGVFVGEDKYTTIESQRLLRLPMFYGLSKKEVSFVVESIKEFYFKKGEQ